ncbi:MAG: prepilin peptidase [Butyrivibrio sp.]|nr:prepilin peptidase [Butyrivibrio sp.]
MINILSTLILILIFMIGASIFSFLNVVAYRSVKKESFVKGRSYCPSCGHQLGATDLIPIISYITLLGKCRYCKKHIPVKDTIFEIIGGILLILTVIKSMTDTGFSLYDIDTGTYYKMLLRVILIFSFFSVMDVISLIDMQTMEIRNRHLTILVVLSIISIFIMPEYTIAQRLIGMLCVSMPMLVVALIIPGGFGGGDIKMMIPVGFFLGWKLTLVGFFISILLGGFWGIYLMLSGKAERKSHFAFGPFLCIGMAASLLYGENLLNAYLGLFLK